VKAELCVERGSAFGVERSCMRADQSTSCSVNVVNRTQPKNGVNRGHSVSTFCELGRSLLVLLLPKAWTALPNGLGAHT